MNGKEFSLPKLMLLHLLKHAEFKGVHVPWLTDEIKSLSYQRNVLKKKGVRLNSEYYHITLIKNAEIKLKNAKLNISTLS